MTPGLAPAPAAALAGALATVPAPEFRLPALHAPEPLGAGTRRLLVGGMVGAHLLAGWALLQIEPVRQALGEVLTIQVDLVAPTPRSLPPPPPPAPRLRTPPPPPAAVIAAAPPPVPQEPPPYVAPPTPPIAPEPPAPAPPAPPMAAEKTPPAPPSPVLAPAPAPAAPRKVVLSDTDWIRPPAYAYPREALRRREAGTVIVRIRFDTQGLPAQVTLQRSSGSAALDEEALAKARAARARPRLMDGLPIEFLADAVAEFKF